MTENGTVDLIRKLVGYISDLIAVGITPTADNTPLLGEAACLLTAALGHLNLATGAAGMGACRFDSCGGHWCCQLTEEQCRARSGAFTDGGACGATPCPGVDEAVHPSGSRPHMAKG